MTWWIYLMSFGIGVVFGMALWDLHIKRFVQKYYYDRLDDDE